MNDLNRLHWSLILGMGALALLHPFMHIIGMTEALGRPFGPLLIMGFISLIWLVIVGFGKVRAPILTLTLTGLTYGVFAILISAIVSPLLEGRLSGPITNPFAFVAVLITNALWGLFVGLVARALQQRS